MGRRIGCNKWSADRVQFLQILCVRYQLLISIIHNRVRPIVSLKLLLENDYHNLLIVSSNFQFFEFGVIPSSCNTKKKRKKKKYERENRERIGRKKKKRKFNKTRNFLCLVQFSPSPPPPTLTTFFFPP